jgi:glucose dehydrogenase
MVAFGLLLVIFGAGQWVNGAGWAAYVLLAGMVIWLSVLFQWFRRPSAKAKAACIRIASTSPTAGA